jgi:hypothetical protein
VKWATLSPVDADNYYSDIASQYYRGASPLAALSIYNFTAVSLCYAEAIQTSLNRTWQNQI